VRRIINPGLRNMAIADALKISPTHHFDFTKIYQPATTCGFAKYFSIFGKRSAR
jgi:hypothetical protein